MNYTVPFNQDRYLEAGLYQNRYLWMLLFGITLLAEPARNIFLFLLSFVFNENPETYTEIEDRIYYGFADGYIHILLFFAIPFIILSSQFFRQIQLVFIKDQRPARFLLFRPSKLIDLLDAVSARETDSGITSYKSFWNVFFAIVQPIYLLIIVFPIGQKIILSGYYNSAVNAVLWLIQLGTSISWIVILYRIFEILKPRQEIAEHQLEQYEVSDENERMLIINKISDLRSIKLRHLLWQLLISLLLPYMIYGFISSYSLFEQIKYFAEGTITEKVAIFSGIYFSLLTLYFSNKIIAAASFFSSSKKALIILNNILFFLPIVSWIWRVSLFTIARRNWNDAIEEGRFHPKLKIPLGITIAFSIFFVLCSLYSTGYLIEFLFHIDMDWFASLHYKIINMVSWFNLIFLHVFAMLVVAFTFLFEERFSSAAKELEASYSNLSQSVTQTEHKAE